ncbi:uncharacterized protein LOC143540932 [Bidens hawaiensis]|uniref:uncharacterized protein LOC143540932 n=1 Tax=Bidens hawaiensis TaxID=980011 RepID=UPI00404A8170
MANIAKLEFPALNITRDNYMPWTAHVKRHLKSMGVLKTIMEGNNCEEQDEAKADVFLHKHIHEMLQFEYLNCEDPYILWKDLKCRFDHRREVLIPTARDEWNNLRFQDFKKVNEYTSALFRICLTLQFCGQTITEENMLEKTFSTFHISNINLQQQYRLQNFKRYSDLNSFILTAEKNNELLMKNHQSRPTGSLAIPEVNVATNNDAKDSGKKWVQGRGRGHFDKSHFNGRNRLFKVYVPIAPPHTKMGPQRRLGIYVGYESASIIRFPEPLTGDVFTARFADCRFHEAFFPALGGEKKKQENDVS